MKTDILLKKIIDVLDNSKAKEITEISLKGKTDIADYMIIATGDSTRQLETFADKVNEFLKSNKISHKIQGEKGDNWVLIDTGDIFIHLFTTETRLLYDIETLWSDEILKLKK